MNELVMSEPDVNKIGFWSALSATIFSIMYIIPQLILGIDMPSTPRDLILILTPSFFLAPAFLILMVCVHCLPHLSSAGRLSNDGFAGFS